MQLLSWNTWVAGNISQMTHSLRKTSTTTVRESDILTSPQESALPFGGEER